MKQVQRLAAALTLTGALTVVSVAQTAPGPGDQALGVGAQGNATPDTNIVRPKYARRSIVHHYPYPYPEYYHGDQYAGFRNPGGVGRFIDYPPGDQFQETGDPVRVARFDTGFGDRAEQMQAQQVGIQRENSIMNNIDRMAAPRLGVGYFGGFN